MKVLVIEDYLPLRCALVQGLGEAGFAVDATGDGNEGLWLAKDGSYSVIILDLMLPGLDGLSLLRRFRNAGNKTPVLILTAKDKIQDRVTGLDHGADDYLVKPFAFEELLARVQALTRRRYDLARSVVAVGPFTLELNAKKVFEGRVAVELTAREFSLLELLAVHKGQVLSRSQIARHLYGFDDEPNSNAIDVHVGQLRRKLESRCGSKLIHTRRGIGYVLDDGEPCDH